MNIELLITNIGFSLSLLMSIGLAILLFVRRPKKDASANIVFFVMSVFGIIWQLSYVCGVNTHDPYLSRIFFMGNLASLFIVISNAHLLLIFTGYFKSNKWFLSGLYSIAACIVLYFSFFPADFLLPSTPQLYLPNFFVPGPLYEIQDVFFFVALLYLLVAIFVTYRRADYQTQNRLKFFILGILFAYGVSLVPEFLLYGIKIDPILASLTGLYTIPIAYAVLKYDLIDLTIFAKRALRYALGVTGITLFILLIGYGNDAISSIIPDFPIWLLPLLSAFVAVALGVFIWKKIKEVDLLKYEFVNVVTHRFRTPLTYSRWALETLRTATDPHDREEAISTIDDANTKLNELTNTLISISNSDDVQYAYTYTSESFLPILNETLAAVHGRVEEKALHIELPYGSSEENTPLLSVDRNRIQFALQMIIENAIIYSPEKSKIVLNTTISKNFLIFSAQDFGIGISKEDIGHLFSKFFRGATARKAYTEGLGIGLYVARDIMHRHGGDLWAESAGLGKGSTFFIKIPISRK